jgi:hypothetical protein
MIGKTLASTTDMKSIRQAADSPDRRGSHRIHTVCRFARVIGCGDSGLWRVCNMSDRGMMLRSRLSPRQGEPLSISLSETAKLEAAVVWSDLEHIGVRFIEPVDSTALLCALATEQRSPHYRSLRLAVDRAAMAVDEAGIHAVRIRNISRHGVGIEHPDSLRRGTGVRLVFDEGAERRGVVRWADQEQAGLFLLEPFSLEEMASARLF